MGLLHCFICMCAMLEVGRTAARPLYRTKQASKAANITFMKSDSMKRRRWACRGSTQ